MNAAGKFMAATVLVLAIVVTVLTVAVVRLNDPHVKAENLAASLSINVVWTNSPCGAEQDSCYAYSKPDTIYLNPNNADVDYLTRWGIAEVIQHRAELGQDQCQAILIARAIGTDFNAC